MAAIFFIVMVAAGVPVYLADQHDLTRIVATVGVVSGWYVRVGTVKNEGQRPNPTIANSGVNWFYYQVTYHGDDGEDHTATINSSRERRGILIGKLEGSDYYNNHPLMWIGTEIDIWYDQDNYSRVFTYKPNPIAGVVLLCIFPALGTAATFIACCVYRCHAPASKGGGAMRGNLRKVANQSELQGEGKKKKKEAVQDKELPFFTTPTSDSALPSAVQGDQAGAAPLSTSN